jgi:hypothetical protein
MISDVHGFVVLFYFFAKDHLLTFGVLPNPFLQPSTVRLLDEVLELIDFPFPPLPG